MSTHPTPEQANRLADIADQLASDITAQESLPDPPRDAIRVDAWRRNERPKEWGDLVRHWEGNRFIVDPGCPVLGNVAASICGEQFSSGSVERFIRIEGVDDVGLFGVTAAHELRKTLKMAIKAVVRSPGYRADRYLDDEN